VAGFVLDFKVGIRDLIKLFIPTESVNANDPYTCQALVTDIEKKQEIIIQKQLCIDQGNYFDPIGALKRVIDREGQRIPDLCNRIDVDEKGMCDNQTQLKGRHFQNLDIELKQDLKCRMVEGAILPVKGQKANPTKDGNTCASARRQDQSFDPAWEQHGTGTEKCTRAAWCSKAPMTDRPMYDAKYACLKAEIEAMKKASAKEKLAKLLEGMANQCKNKKSCTASVGDYKDLDGANAKLYRESEVTPEAPSSLYDLNRGMIVAETPSDLIEVVNAAGGVFKKYGYEVTSFKNRFCNVESSGYMDMKLSVKRITDDESWGEQSEIQFLISPFVVQKSHTQGKKYRDVNGATKDVNDPLIAASQTYAEGITTIPTFSTYFHNGHLMYERARVVSDENSVAFILPSFMQRLMNDQAADAEFGTKDARLDDKKSLTQVCAAANKFSTLSFVDYAKKHKNSEYFKLMVYEIDSNIKNDGTQCEEGQMFGGNSDQQDNRRKEIANKIQKAEEDAKKCIDEARDNNDDDVKMACLNDFDKALNIVAQTSDEAKKAKEEGKHVRDKVDTATMNKFVSFIKKAHFCKHSPTMSPTAAPTNAPTMSPTAAPTNAPTMSPTAAPTATPTKPCEGVSSKGCPFEKTLCDKCAHKCSWSSAKGQCVVKSKSIWEDELGLVQSNLRSESNINRRLLLVRGQDATCEDSSQPEDFFMDGAGITYTLSLGFGIGAGQIETFGPDQFITDVTNYAPGETAECKVTDTEKDQSEDSFLINMEPKVKVLTTELTQVQSELGSRADSSASGNVALRASFGLFYKLLNEGELNTDFCLGSTDACKAKDTKRSVFGQVSLLLGGATLSVKTSKVTLASLFYIVAGDRGEKTLSSLPTKMAGVGAPSMSLNLKLVQGSVQLEGKIGETGELSGNADTQTGDMSLQLKMEPKKPIKWRIGDMIAATIDTFSATINREDGETTLIGKIEGDLKIVVAGTGFDSMGSAAGEIIVKPSENSMTTKFTTHTAMVDLPILGTKTLLSGETVMSVTMEGGKMTSAYCSFDSIPSKLEFINLKKYGLLKAVLKYFSDNTTVKVQGKIDAITKEIKFTLIFEGDFSMSIGKTLKMTASTLTVGLERAEGADKMTPIFHTKGTVSGEGWGPLAVEIDGKINPEGDFAFKGHASGNLWGSAAHIAVSSTVKGDPDVILMATLDKVSMGDIPLLKGIAAADVGSIQDGVLVLANHDGVLGDAEYKAGITVRGVIKGGSEGASGAAGDMVTRFEKSFKGGVDIKSITLAAWFATKKGSHRKRDYAISLGIAGSLTYTMTKQNQKVVTLELINPTAGIVTDDVSVSRSVSVSGSVDIQLGTKSSKASLDHVTMSLVEGGFELKGTTTLYGQKVPIEVAHVDQLPGTFHTAPTPAWESLETLANEVRGSMEGSSSSLLELSGVDDWTDGNDEVYKYGGKFNHTQAMSKKQYSSFRAKKSIVRRNIMDLKAYALAISDAGSMDDDAQVSTSASSVSAMLKYLATDGFTDQERNEVRTEHKDKVRFNPNHKEVRLDPVEQYQRGVSKLMSGGAGGLYTYFLTRLHKALATESGILIDKGGKVMLKSTSLGLPGDDTEADDWFNSIAVKERDYKRMEIDVTSANYKPVSEVVKQLHGMHSESEMVKQMFFDCVSKDVSDYQWKANRIVCPTGCGHSKKDGRGSVECISPETGEDTLIGDEPSQYCEEKCRPEMPLTHCEATPACKTVSSSLVINGISADSFDEKQQVAFKRGISDSLGHEVDASDIDIVYFDDESAEKPTSRRLLNKGGLDVKYTVNAPEGLELRDRIVKAAESGELVNNIQEEAPHHTESLTLAPILSLTRISG